MERIIAYCGLTCTDCPSYAATQSGDRAELERVAAMWREEFDAPELMAESIQCDGCLGTEGRKCGHCSECEMRACAMALNLANCGHCTDYACDKLEAFFGFVPEARTTLDEVRAGLAN
jgi:hypothetical protein